MGLGKDPSRNQGICQTGSMALAWRVMPLYERPIACPADPLQYHRILLWPLLTKPSECTEDGVASQAFVARHSILSFRVLC